VYPEWSDAPDAATGGIQDPRIPPGVRDVERGFGKRVRVGFVLLAAGSLLTGLMGGTIIRPYLSHGIQLLLLIALSIIGCSVLVIDALLKKYVWNNFKRSDSEGKLK